MNSYHLDLKDYTRSPSPLAKRPRQSIGSLRSSQQDERENSSNDNVEFSSDHHEAAVGSSASSVCIITKQVNNNGSTNENVSNVHTSDGTKGTGLDGSKNC